MSLPRVVLSSPLMIPTDYRLEQVSARLIERLEGTRRSHSDPAQALPAFERIAEEHVTAALDDAEAYVPPEELAHHGRFLREEVHSTFLPRYHRLATAMTADEERGHGLGTLVRPVGRLALVALAVVVFLALSRFMYTPVVWPLVVLDLSLPFWPDVIAGLRRRQYKRELMSLLEDMTRIQEQASVYGIPEELDRLAHEATISAPAQKKPVSQKEDAS